MTASITRPKPKKTADKAQSPYKRLHVIIPIEDLLWASQQKPSVTQLWQESWTADPYGSRWMPLTSALGYSTFISVKKILSESGLFIFKPDKSIQDSRETVTWMVKNLHGSRMKEFWEKANSEKQESNSEKRESNAGDSEIDAAPEEIDALYKASILGQSQPEQGFQKPSRTVQEHLTNSTKEFVRCNSDTQPVISHCEETAIAPLGVASPHFVGGVSENDIDLPVAIDCTTLALVDDAPSQPALFPAESQDCEVEPRDCHEGACSAASPAQIEKSSTSAIADQKIEPSCSSAELMTENSVSGEGVKADHEGKGSAAPVLNPEKWSHEAIVARSNLRPERMQKFKVAANSGQNPGLGFLQECWNDPALQIVIKKLLAKFPQWGVAIVDGVLVDWER
ncbi:hypothetical protein GNF10_33335 [Nostoc sp. UCD121]|uniref:hypothetical protein n=1 Tax=unclassified Nostoc TaxID=2593658 RepID=UPI001624A8F7|nr:MULTISPECIES: hypothetical protein [unclassified Nostoc]MBC1223311.1 hypothetical protein [Nostoc sp. UCD120]MBC1280694.1 hypothetical protein [Nostoc sp. UCD121]MBC1299156.1 hypothetical protein [Nostoc sp. UCD122]